MSRARVGIIAAWLLVMAVAVYAVQDHEKTLHDGQLVLLRLAPVDPRSLMQGDYMALRFEVDAQLRAEDGKWPKYAYLQLGAGSRTSFAGMGDALTTEPGRVSMRIRPGVRGASLGPNAFFFQEGQAALYENARWGGFRVAADGTALLTSLYSEELELLGNNRR
ncbi:Uncharacterized membrane-anchored protein [Halopseudomonas litoralis]|uniref:Uncharacterized membrane-anchored protein n=1 Tax=Halopseudomonas litoralis TaxID=797277 RepID=A0A1H1SSA0_9GAMM|nr:GDYXXLXY domain-containing protein [Halopseudomonas litoralis]SDS50733.1 Uncharacterized membrane-anchored protein [Halopseudomonas litoralis]